MSKLIQKLQHDHLHLVNTISEISKSGLGSSKSRETLLSIKKMLIKHLETEDTELYPFLEEKSIDNKEIEATVKNFRKEIIETKSFAIDFFSRFEKDPDNPAFAAEIKKLNYALALRIKDEERILFPLYEKMQLV